MRSNGNNCCCVKYTATAPISGPYWMGAVTPGGEGGLRELLTTWTQLVFDAVFLHDQPWRGHVHHLPTQRDAGLHLAQILLTGRADADLMLNHFIGRLRKPQGRSRVSLLPSGLLLAPWAQAFWLPHKAIGGRGQAAIAAVFRQPILQVFHLLGQISNLGLHLLHQQVLLAEQGFLLLDSFITLCHLFTQALIFFFEAHACTLLAFTPFGKSRMDVGSYMYSWLRVERTGREETRKRS